MENVYIGPLKIVNNKELRKLEREYNLSLVNLNNIVVKYFDDGTYLLDFDRLKRTLDTLQYG